MDMKKKKWFDEHIGQLNQSLDESPMIGFMKYSELFDEYWDLFHVGISQDYATYLGELEKDNE